jgi:signal transduction histidine kinase
LLQLQGGLDAAALDHIDETKRACDLLAALGDRVRACAGCSSPSIRSIAPRPALLPLPATLEKTAGARGITLQTHASPDLPQVMADPACLRDILCELVANAIEASPDKSTVAVEILAPGVWNPEEYTHLDVFVRNPSPPLANSDLLSFFLPFSTSKGGNHAGMGLHFALVLATQMHMPLGVRNSGGSTDFWLRLPVG